MSTDLQRGTDIARYYQDLLENPPSMVSYNPDALKILIERAKKGLSPEDAFTIGTLAGPISSKGWDIVQHEPFYFPEDNGPHYDIRKEWWYIICSFDVTGHKNPLSVLIVFTRRGTVPSYMRRAGQDGKDSQVVCLQTYVTIPSKDDHYSFRYYTDGNSATMKSKPFELSTPDTFYIKSVSDDSIFPMDISIKYGSKIDIHITLTSSNNPTWFPQGNNGCAPCISGIGYRYYSSPNIIAQGSIKVESNTFDKIKGSAWIDHNWESRINPLGYTKNYYLRSLSNISQFIGTPKINIRWNWFFVRLDNDTEITSALIPAPDQNTKDKFDLTKSILLYNFENMKRKNIPGHVNYTSFIKSPTGTTYPIGWHLYFPSEDISITLTPTVTNQFCYAEDNSEFMGAGVVVDGTKDGKKITGTGFVKCIHYESDHEFINNSLKSLDYTSDKINDVIQSFYPVKPNGWLFAFSLFIAILPLLLIILVTVFMVLIIQMNMKDKKNA